LGALDYYDDCTLPYHDRTHHEGRHWESLKAKGVPEKEIDFLRWVLNPVPTDRPTAQEILDAGWFTSNTDETGRIAEGLKSRVEESRRKNVQRKHSEPLLATSFVSQPVKQLQVPLEVAASTALPSTPMPRETQPVAFQPVNFQSIPPVAFQTREEVQNARTVTPRSSTQRPAGATFINYGSFMR
jgi:serine/threonine protein kinase